MSGMYPDNRDIEIFGEQVRWPGLGADGKFTNGDFSDPLVKPSFIPAETVNLILDNLAELIASLGGKPNNSDTGQLKDAIVSALTLKADLESPTFTGNPNVPSDSAAVPAAARPTTEQSTRIATVGQIAATRDAINVERYKVGSYYTQYPIVGQNTFAGMFPENESPGVLFGGTWSLQYDTEEVFFRTPGPGGDVGEYRGKAWSADNKWDAPGGIPGIEPDMMRRILGNTGLHSSLNSSGKYTDALTTNHKNNPFYFANSIMTGTILGISAVTYQPTGVMFDTSRAFPTGSKNVPKNRLMRIWKKIKD